MRKNWSDTWLSYPIHRESHKNIILIRNRFTDSDHNAIIKNALTELKHGLQTMLSVPVSENDSPESDSASDSASIYLENSILIPKDGYRISLQNSCGHIEASTASGVLYGVFAFLREIQFQSHVLFESVTFQKECAPSQPMRMLNHWDNLDGSIERGYSGRSFFFDHDEILLNDRIQDYARMIASVGINGVVINNVNVSGAAVELITDRYYEKLRTYCEIFASYGVTTYLSVSFASPVLLEELDSADPLDPSVISWWAHKAKEIWKNLPLLGGFLVKADSEGRPGPFTYGRNLVDGANLLARAVRPFGGIVIWRCFVYNCQQDWRSRKEDRARACYDHFMPLDGQFDSNVILQIKNGPMDFQVREPVSPLFGGLLHTNMMLEVQIAQEYTGQQRHVCYLIPWFKEILEQDLACPSGATKVKDLIRTNHSEASDLYGMTAVANTGNDENWTGHDCAAANLYGFGRLAFDHSLSAEDIAWEWIQLTFGNKENVIRILQDILMRSWPAYEKYTSPLGIGWMINPGHHYGPNVDGYEYDRWGTYHRADLKGIGVDRTKNGTGYTAQYHPALCALYEDVKTCPEELILFFHHLNYDYVLKTGKTVLQHIYDTHFEGARDAEEFLNLFQSLEKDLPEEAYQRMLPRFTHQAEHAKEWCDVVNSYFYRKTGIEDLHHRKIY